MNRYILVVLSVLLTACATEPFVTDDGSAAAQSAHQDARYHAEHPTIPIRSPNLPPDFVK